MTSLYERSNGIECRACGAAFAQPDEEGPFCQPCMSKFRYEWGGSSRTRNSSALSGGLGREDALNKWLARQLELNLVRKKKYGFVARCEALTKQDQNQNAGYQCPRYATQISCGRYLCAVHAKPVDTSKPEYIRTKDMPSRNVQGKHGRTMFINEYKDPYDWLQEMIADLCKIDTDFKMSVLKGVGIFK